MGTLPGTGASSVRVVAVATPYTWDVVETCWRAGLDPVCVDNHGTADPTLPGLRALGEAEDPTVPWLLGLSSGVHRGRAAVALAALGFGEPLALVDPTAVVGRTVEVAHGSYVNAGAVVGAQTRLGCSAHVNRSASVGHHCELGFAASLGPAATLAGHVRVGASAFVGAGATVLPGVRIGTGAVVGAGAVVTKDVPDHEIWVGSPARRLRAHDQEVASSCPHCSTT